MRTLVRTLSALALVVALALVPATAATAAKQPEPKAKVAKWAKKNHLTGSWRASDTDRDGLKNLQEFQLGTDPREDDTDGDGLHDGDEVSVGDDPTDPDTDGDNVKDGAEHSGVVTAYDGETVTIRQFKGAKLTATLAGDVKCFKADDADDQGADDSDAGDGDRTDGGGDDPGAAAATVDDGGDEVDLGAGDATSTCDDAGLEKGAVVRSIELQRVGGDLVITALELA
jgi:hypothetical protein